jgi:hypothetical protein
MSEPLTEDIVPTIDDHERLTPDQPPEATYRDWTPDQTMVITYTTNPEKFRKDWACASRDWARDHCAAKYGRILEEVALPERFFFRVYRPSFRK